MSCKTVSVRRLPRRLDGRADYGGAPLSAWSTLGGLFLVLSQAGCLAFAPDGSDGETSPNVVDAKQALSHGTLHGEQCTQTDQDMLQSFALYTTDFIQLAANSTVSGGNVGVRDPASPPSDPNVNFQLKLLTNFEQTAGATIDPTKLSIARKIQLQSQAVIGDMKTGTLQDQGSMSHGGVSAFPSSTPIPPAISQVTEGAMDITVPGAAGASLNLPSGVYGDVQVGANKQLNLTGDSYVFRKLTVGMNGRVLANVTGTTVQVVKTVQLNDHAIVEPKAGFSAKDLRVVSAADTSVDAVTIDITTNVDAHALFIAPNGHLTIAAGSTLTGAAFTKSIALGSGSNVNWEDGIPGEECEPYDCTGPAVDDGDPCTVYECTPEYGPKQVPAPDGTACDFDGDPGACLTGMCAELCSSTAQQIVGDPYQNVIVPAPAPTPTGKYLVKYADGCMRYNPLWWWSVNAVEDGEFTWFLMEADDQTVMPGTFGFFNNAAGGPTPRDKPGFPTQAECIAANLLEPAIVVDHAGNDRIGVKLFDHPHTDNRITDKMTGPMGGKRPAWNITPFAPPFGPDCGQ